MRRLLAAQARALFKDGITQRERGGTRGGDYEPSTSVKKAVIWSNAGP